jgi:hypothetical protein
VRIRPRTAPDGCRLRKAENEGKLKIKPFLFGHLENYSYLCTRVKQLSQTI